MRARAFPFRRGDDRTEPLLAGHHAWGCPEPSLPSPPGPSPARTPGSPFAQAEGGTPSVPGAPPSSWDHRRTPSADGNDGRLDLPGGRGSPGPGGPPTKGPGSARRTAPTTRPEPTRVRRRKLQPAGRKLRPRTAGPAGDRRTPRGALGGLAGQEPTPASRADASLHEELTYESDGRRRHLASVAAAARTTRSRSFCGLARCGC